MTTAKATTKVAPKQETETTNGQADETVKDYTSVDRTLGEALNYFAAETRTYSALATRLKAAEGDRAAALKAFVDSSTDPEVVKLRDGIAQLKLKLNKLAEDKVVSETLDETAKGKLVTELETLKDNLRNGRKAILTMANSMKMAVNVESIEAALEEIGDPTRSGRGRPVGSTGSSLPKASAILKLKSSENDKDTWEFQTFTEAAKHLNIGKEGVELLQKAFAEAAGVAHNEISSVDKPQSFVVGPFGNSTATWTITTTPKARKKPGPRPSKDSAELPPSATAKDASK